MTLRDNDENMVPFQGAKLNRSAANQAGFGIIAGLIGIGAAVTLFGFEQKLISLVIVAVCAGIGFFLSGYVINTKKSNKA